MNELREFQIDIFGLSHGQHEFRYEIRDNLFKIHKQGILEKGKGQCLLDLQKSETMMTLQFNIDVEVELVCDRSLDPFIHPIKLKETIIIKFGDDNYSLSEDVLVIKSDTPSLNVSEFIYEFIMLAVPMKKLHPRYGAQDEQPDLIYSSREETTDEEKATDPRWEALKKLKKK